MIKSTKWKRGSIVFVFVIALLGFSLSTVSATFEISLKSRHFVPEKKIDSSTRTKIDAFSEVDKNIHLLVQFNRDLTEEEINELEDNGLELLSYVPNNAWLVSLSPRKKDMLLSKSTINAVVYLDNKDKMSQYIAKNKFASWSVDNFGNTYLHVQFFKDVNIDYAKKNR